MPHFLYITFSLQCNRKMSLFCCGMLWSIDIDLITFCCTISKERNSVHSYCWGNLPIRIYQNDWERRNDPWSRSDHLAAGTWPVLVCENAGRPYGSARTFIFFVSRKCNAQFETLELVIIVMCWVLCLPPLLCRGSEWDLKYNFSNSVFSRGGVC